MNIYDAAKILGLSGELRPEDTKTAYKTACKKYHPDINPAGEEMMKIVNQAYEVLKEFSGCVKEQNTNYGELLNDALNAVSSFSGILVEVCGSWVWVTGHTRPYKNTLKEAGYKWAPKKQAWYFRPEDYQSRSKGNKSLEEIREKYGSYKPKHNYHIIEKK